MVPGMNTAHRAWIAGLLVAACGGAAADATRPVNVLLVTLDDMGFGTTGMEGCPVPDITPNLDKLAAQGILFTHGYNLSPICGPSRNALLSGRYPHANGAMGHGVQPPPLWQPPRVATPTVTRYLRQFGYLTGAILKFSREINNDWDTFYQELPFGVGFHDRNPDSFYARARAFIDDATARGRPFFLYANPIDPHDPWPDTDQEKRMLADWNPDRPYPAPTRRYAPAEIEIPPFLPDLPKVREAMVPYYESLHRGDACIGEILRALEDSGRADSTIVVFVSDNGLCALGGKTTLHPSGVRTPIVVRGPGVARGVVNREAVISTVDILPTLLEALGLPAIGNLEGRSFHSLLAGDGGGGFRDYAYAASTYFADSTPDHFMPHRAILDRDYCYIWNSYVIRTNGGKKFPRNHIGVVAPYNNAEHPEVKGKIDRILNKPVEELYDLNRDPGCWTNLADASAAAEALNRYRKRLVDEMEATEDPELSVPWKAFDPFRKPRAP